MNKHISLVFALFLTFISCEAFSGTTWIYQVSLSGVVNTATQFYRSGYLVLTPTITSTTNNGVNPIDLALVSGNPVVSPNPGAIQYFTNYYLYKLIGGRGTSQLDLAYVSISGNCILVQPHTNFLMGLNKQNPSIFTARDGTYAQLYFISARSMQVCSNDGWKTVTGNIDYWGSSFYGTPYPTMPYRGSFAGKYVGSGNI